MALENASAPLTSEQQMNMFRLRDKMSLLNSEFLRVLNGFYTEKNHYDFTGTMQSYMEHVQKLKAMYKVDDEVDVAMGTTSLLSKANPKRTEILSESSGGVPLRKIAKATRRNGTPAPHATDSPKIINRAAFAASSPATVTSVPKFGDISVITKETPAPLQKIVAAIEPSAPPTARKRAIRGGGPLGGAESVIFKSGNAPESSKSTVQIPTTNIKFPEPSKDFWTKKNTGSGEETTESNNSKSLFAFLGKDDNKPKDPIKFTGFSFGKKPDSVGDSGTKADNTSGTSLFGSQKSIGNSPKPQIESLFGASSKVDTTSPNKPSVFSESKEKSNDDQGSAAKPFSALSFGASLFGSSASKPVSATASTLSFSSGTSAPSGPLFSGFAGLTQKAVDYQSKPDGGEDDEGEYVPPKAETVESEEPDAILSSKVSVFKFTGKEYTKLGVGMLHVKVNDGKSSVLIRAATATGTVWLNALCNKAMKATKVDDKGDRIRLTCPASSTEMATLMIRFGTADGAKSFTDKIDELAK